MGAAPLRRMLRGAGDERELGAVGPPCQLALEVAGGGVTLAGAKETRGAAGAVVELPVRARSSPSAMMRLSSSGYAAALAEEEKLPLASRPPARLL